MAETETTSGIPAHELWAKIANSRREDTPTERLLTVAEIAAAAKTTKQNVYKWINAGTLPVVSLGPRSTRIRPAAWERFLQEHEGD